MDARVAALVKVIALAVRLESSDEVKALRNTPRDALAGIISREE